MKTTLAWLSTHLETEAPLAAIVERRVGIEMGLEPAQCRLHRAIPPTIEGTSSGTKP